MYKRRIPRRGRRKTYKKRRITKRRILKRKRVTKIRDYDAPVRYGFHQSKSGRRVRKRTFVDQLVAANVQRLDYTFKGLGEFDAQAGFYAMNKIETVPLDGTHSLPLYALSVDSVINGPTAIAGRPLRRLFINQATGVLSWKDQVGQDSDSTPFPGVQFDSTRSGFLTDVDAIAGKQLFQKWINLKVNCYRADNRPVRMRLQLVRCLEPHSYPWRYAADSPVPFIGAQPYYQIVKPLIANPIADNNMLIRKPFKVYQTWEININQTGDPVFNASQTLNIFKRMNRRVRFDQLVLDDAASGKPTTFAVFNNEGFDPAQRSAGALLPRETEGMFFIITGIAYNDAQEAAGINDLTFDINLRSSYARLA